MFKHLRREIFYWSSVFFVEKPKNFFYYTVLNTTGRFIQSLKERYPEYSFTKGTILIAKEKHGHYKYTVYFKQDIPICLLYIKKLPRFYWLSDKIVYLGVLKYAR